MHKKWMILLLAGSFLVLAATASIGLAQAPQEPAVAKKVPGSISLTGTIVNSKQYGGYVIFRKKPHEEYKILNVNEPVLSELAKKGEPVQIEGHFKSGAYFVVIDKINGKDYTAPQK